MNPYININRIEFVITQACSSRCKHCSLGELSDKGSSIDADAAVTAMGRLSEKYGIKSILTFGGEPLLFADTVYKIQAAARDCGIPERSIITNGFFTKDESKISEVAKNLYTCGVNYVMLSVDAFHQEFIPVHLVEKFAEALLLYDIPVFKVHPAWVVNADAGNAYNAETRRLIKIFADKGIPASRGNNILLAGNALKYLEEFYPPRDAVDLSVPCGSLPHTGRPDDVDCISIAPGGDVRACSVMGNIYQDDILDIIRSYDPYADPGLRAVLEGGVSGLLRYGESQGIVTDISECRSICGVCRKVRAGMTSAS